MASNPFERAKFKQQVQVAQKPTRINPINPSEESLRALGANPEKARAELAYNALGAANTASFGIPRAIANKVAGKEVVRKGGNFGRLVGLLPAGGLVRGAVSKLVPGLIGRGVVKGATRGAVEGAALSQAIEPGPESALVGAATGAVAEPVAAGVGNLYSATFGKARFLKDTQKQFGSAVRRSKGKFGKFLKDARTNFPGRNVDFSNSVNELRVSRTYNPEVDRLIESNPNLKRLVDNPQYATQIPVDEAQDYINLFSGKLPSSGPNLGPQYRPRDLNVLKSKDIMKETQATAFPEIKPVRREYANTKQVERTVGPRLRDQNIEGSLERGFPTLIDEKLEKVIGKEGVKRLKGYKQARKAVDLVTNPMTAGGAGAIGLGYLSLKKLANRSQGDSRG